MPKSCLFLSGARPAPGDAALFSRCFHSGLRRDLANVFLKTPGVYRLLHPLYSVAAVGPGAAERQRAG
ncbi:hypothetical protein [uncultured Victivallis sp.]|uniref:hypothetical protein n=1 Tax=uncultured Victivallis sp. TaxID=354118 RepID=UPI00259493AE|nr:hypothetical protein [uncultured Victivallis sp.]